MDEHVITHEINTFYHPNNEIQETPALIYNTGTPVSGVLLTTAGERIPFMRFHVYTTVEGFAAYVDNNGKTSLINRTHIQRILLDDDFRE